MNVLCWVEIDFSEGEETYTTNGIVLADNAGSALRKFIQYATLGLDITYIRMKVYPLQSEVHVCK